MEIAKKVTIMKSTKTFIVIGVIAGFAFFVLAIAYVGQGNVRERSLLLGEKVEQTIALEQIDNQLHVIGVRGIGGLDPTLVMRSDYPYFLNIINRDEIGHRFYIEGLNVTSKYIPSNDMDTILIYGSPVGTYQYYVLTRGEKVLSGEFRSTKVCDFC